MVERRSTDPVHDLEGAFVTPGLWDSHIHLLDYGRSFRRLKFRPDDSLERVTAAVLERARHVPAGQWIFGGGWNRARFSTDPDRQILDRVAPGHPVLLMSWDYHTAWLNRLALERLGLSNVPGDRDSYGRWTGILREAEAFSAQERAMAQDETAPEDDLARGMREAAKLGLTGVTTIENSRGLAALLAGPRMLRAGVFLRADHAPSLLDLGIRAGFGDQWVRILGIKWFLDGALGSGTAWLKEPYTDDPHNYGIDALPAENLEAEAARLHQASLLLAVHAIGDRAVEKAHRVLTHAPMLGDGRRSRIEHAQLIADEDLAAIQRSEAALSMQPVHLLVDRPIADKKWGVSRSRAAFRFRDVVDRGIPLVFGSDAPVASPDPILGLWAAVHQAAPGESAWHPEQALTPDEALSAYTRTPAMIDGRPAGILAPGYWADLTLWEGDPRVALIHSDFKGLRVRGTVVGGTRIG